MSWKHKRNFVCQEEPRFNWRHDGDIRWHNSPEFDYESKCYFEFPQYEWRSIKANAKRHTLTSFQCRVKQNKFICKCYFSTHILNAFMSISATTRINERQTDEDITNNKSDSDMLNRQSLSMFSSNWQWFLIKSVDKCKVYKKKERIKKRNTRQPKISRCEQLRQRIRDQPAAHFIQQIGKFRLWHWWGH